MLYIVSKNNTDVAYYNFNALLGIYISATFSTVTHVEHILTVANQRMYLLTQLENWGCHVQL